MASMAAIGSMEISPFPPNHADSHPCDADTGHGEAQDLGESRSDIEERAVLHHT